MDDAHNNIDNNNINNYNEIDSYCLTCNNIINKFYYLHFILRLSLLALLKFY